jgi:hypothetical protein
MALAVESTSPESCAEVNTHLTFAAIDDTDVKADCAVNVQRPLVIELRWRPDLLLRVRSAL